MSTPIEWEPKWEYSKVKCDKCGKLSMIREDHYKDTMEILCSNKACNHYWWFIKGREGRFYSDVSDYVIIREGKTLDPATGLERDPLNPRVPLPEKNRT